MMCVTVSQAVCDSSIIFRHDGVKYFENFAIVGINRHLSIMKHTFVTTEPCRSRKLSLSEQTVIINDERSVLADWVSNPQFAGLNMAGLKRNHCIWYLCTPKTWYDERFMGTVLVSKKHFDLLILLFIKSRAFTMHDSLSVCMAFSHSISHVTWGRWDVGWGRLYQKTLYPGTEWGSRRSTSWKLYPTRE